VIRNYKTLKNRWRAASFLRMWGFLLLSVF